MSDSVPMRHGAFTITREIAASRDLVYEIWTELEHRREWFRGPEWIEAERSLDLREGGRELSRGHFPDGTETRYLSHFMVVEPGTRLIHAFDMQVNGEPFSASLVGVEFTDSSAGTVITYTEQGFFLIGDYDAESRQEGGEWLIDRMVEYLRRVRASRSRSELSGS